jgi:hypothetical protein
MKPVQTPDSNATLTLTDNDGEPMPDRDLPVQRYLGYDTSAGESKEDARLMWETIWQPDENEARRLEAGACVRVTITASAHPPLAVGVTDAIVPERELIDRGHVDRALGHLYAELKARFNPDIAPTLPSDDVYRDAHEMLPEPSEFADLWIASVEATRPGADNGAGGSDA